MFRTEYRNFCKLYQLDGQIGKRSNPPDRFSMSWPVVTQGEQWRVETTYEFLRWEDIIHRDFEQPSWRPTLIALRTFGLMLIDGCFVQIFRAHWRFGLFLAYPYALLLGWILISAAAGVLVAAIAASFAMPTAVPQLLGLVCAAAVFTALVRRTESRSYMLYLFRDATSVDQYARRTTLDLNERLETFAGYLVEAARAGAADEIVIVGHSSGSFLAVDVLTRALARDPELGCRGARVTLLTVGANLPVVGFQRHAGWFRDRIAQLASVSSIDWVDYQSRRDIMNFFRFDPIAGHGVDAKQSKINLQVVPVQFRDIVSPERFSWLRWHFFEMHFQFLKANERPAAYDYYMICAGPFSLRTRLAMPDDVVAAVADDKDAARAAWDRIISKRGGDTGNLAAQAIQASSP